MIQFFLILFETIFVVFFIMHMIKRGHDLYALAFFTLFIYTIFAQIGYVYFPIFSEIAGAYFGPQLFYKYWFFMFFSFSLSFLLYRIIVKNIHGHVAYKVRKARWKYGHSLFLMIAIVLLILLSIYFIFNRSEFGYGGGRPMGPPWFGVGFWILMLCMLITYSLFRDPSNCKTKRTRALVLFTFSALFFLEVSIASGTRSPIFYMFSSIIFYEMTPIYKFIKFEKKKLLTIIALFICVIIFLSALRGLRTLGDELSFSSFLKVGDNETQFTGQDLSELILLQDYYLPSHTLFISMNYNIVQPQTVFVSNILNSLIGMNYPFMSTIIVEVATGISDERGAGWAFHYFVEGYNAAGMFGIFYNAIFFNLGMLLWIKLCQSSNEKHNRLMQSMIVLVLVLVMRSQNSAFIQFYWFFLLPGLFLALIANNSGIQFHRFLRS
jgi:hypothetical protein